MHDIAEDGMPVTMTRRELKDLILLSIQYAQEEIDDQDYHSAHQILDSIRRMVDLL